MESERRTDKDQHSCPYCNADMAEACFPFCKACGVAIFYCSKCGNPMSRDSKVCPHCRAKVKD